eukprot:7584694-Pyramimonas_sp.AAC.1
MAGEVGGIIYGFIPKFQSNGLGRNSPGILQWYVGWYAYNGNPHAKWSCRAAPRTQRKQQTI